MPTSASTTQGWTRIRFMFRYRAFARRDTAEPAAHGGSWAGWKKCDDLASPFDAHAEEGDEQRGLIRADDEAVHGVGCAAHAIQAAVAEVSTGEPGVGDVGAAEIAVAEDHAGKVGGVEIGLSEIAS